MLNLLLGPVGTGGGPRLLSAVLVVALFVASAASVSGGSVTPGAEFTAEQRAYWAFQVVARPAEPAVQDGDWARNPIDGFVLSALEAEGLVPAQPAGKVELLRRAYFDLVGLPPSPSEAHEFLADNSPGAYERLVERLLASPSYGERWGRHWLDLARFAESAGFETDDTRPNAWRYRDYVIESFNRDKPYDRFVKEQIAGDELWPESFDARLATAFNRHYPEEGNQKDLLLARQETLHEITGVVGSAFLGLTVGCAQCHDHKFDPITQADYYRLQAFFANVNHVDRFPVVPDEELWEYERKLSLWEERTAPVWEEMSDLLMPLRNFTPQQLLSRYPDYVIEAVRKPVEERSRMEVWMVSLLETKDCGTCPLRPRPYLDPLFRNVVNKLEGESKVRFEELERQLEDLAHLKPAEIDRGMGVADVNDRPPPTHVLGTGLYTNPGEEVQPGFLSILDPSPPVISKPARGGSSGRRSALAKWLTDEANPLTARVMVNRIWHHHFGRGIVSTPSDFGMMGERPTHPELLDWLAAEFVDSGWSVKRIHQLVMTSSAYRQSARPGERGASATGEDAAAGMAFHRGGEVDPSNRLLWRFPPSRLEGEVIRDSALAVAGLLNGRVGGPSVFPPLPEGMPKPRGGWDATESSGEHRRRSVYIFVRRNSPYPMLDAFDFPDTHEPCARRNRTTTAPQALALLNGAEPSEWARAFAQRVLAEAGTDEGGQVETAYRLAYTRPPDPAERDTALTFLDRHAGIFEDGVQGAEPAAVPDRLPPGVSSKHAAALVDLCLMLLNSNEFVYRF